MTNQVLWLGLTGGIGSGKSTVASMLAGQGSAVIDADALSRAATASGGTAIGAIRAEFGEAFIGLDGALDRDKMRAQVYADPHARKRLEAIVHPLVEEQIAAQAQIFALSGKRCIVFDIPLLVESGRWRQRLHRVMVIDCSPATQIDRVTARSGLPAGQVQSIVDAQASRELRLGAADIVLCNDGLTLPELADLVQQIAPQFGL